AALLDSLHVGYAPCRLICHESSIGRIVEVDSGGHYLLKTNVSVGINLIENVCGETHRHNKRARCAKWRQALYEPVCFPPGKGIGVRVGGCRLQLTLVCFPWIREEGLSLMKDLQLRISIRNLGHPSEVGWSARNLNRWRPIPLVNGSAEEHV